MKNLFLLLILLSVGFACHKIDNDNHTTGPADTCDIKTDIVPPDGYSLHSIGGIDFNGSVQAFQFVNPQTGFALLNNNVGGYVEVFKTSDGGQTWSNLNIGIQQYPIGMVFRDENVGIITVHDITGCPPPNCLNKCVVLQTEDGGQTWEAVDIEALKGVLYHPVYDSAGNLYANLYLDGQSALMKSTDNGTNWDTLFSAPELDFSLSTFSFRLYQDKIFAATKENKVLVINTDGQLLQTIEIPGSRIWDMDIIDENNWVAVLSGKVAKTNNGGDIWETIYEANARMIGFDSPDKGLLLLEKSSCPNDVYQVNDLIASTLNGGLSWIEPEESTTNLRIVFSNSQKLSAGKWRVMLGNKLLEIREN